MPWLPRLRDRARRKFLLRRSRRRLAARYLSSAPQLDEYDRHLLARWGWLLRLPAAERHELRRQGQIRPGGPIQCSFCGTPLIDPTDYCPRCGL